MIVRRGLLLLKAFPEVVPDTTFQQSLLGKGLVELSHVENLPQRLPIVLAAALIAAAAIGLGDLTGGLLGFRDRLRWPVPDRAGLRPRGGDPRRADARRRPDGLARSLVGPHRPGHAWPASGSSDPAHGVRSRQAGPSRRQARDPEKPPPGAAPIGSLALRPADRAVRGDHDPGLDAAGDRLRRHRVSPARAQGVFPGRADRIPAAQHLHEHAVRRGDAPPARHGSDGGLVVGSAGRPAPRRAVRAGRGRAHPRDRRARSRRGRAGSRPSSTSRRPGSTASA